jgi:hypothetical protein
MTSVHNAFSRLRVVDVLLLQDRYWVRGNKGSAEEKDNLVAMSLIYLQTVAI